MTTDNTAHPVPTPAPVAVPEGGWRKGDWIVTDLAFVAAYDLPGDSEPWAWSVDTWDTEKNIEEMFREGRVVYVHAPREDARPEPVVAPLPSEAAVEDLAAVIRKARMTAYPDGKDGWLFRDSSDAEMADAVLAAGYRLVSEDDEDTVRVPREAVERLRKAVDSQSPITGFGWRDVTRAVGDVLDGAR